MSKLLNEVSEPEEISVHAVSTGEGGIGLLGQGSAVGVRGDGGTWHGVAGISTSTVGGAGVAGIGDPGPGVTGTSTKWIGVYGESSGTENGPSAVMGEGKSGAVGVKGHASGSGIAAVAGYHLTDSGPGIYGKGSPAGFFDGDVVVIGDIQLPNADCAEDFDVADPDKVEPGTVMVLDDEGGLRTSHRPYDRRVAGVVSGAGAYRPGIVLDKQASSEGRKPIALIGKVYCKVDAAFGAVGVGDLLTTSPTPGHAMRVDDPGQAFGAVLGKALRPLADGQGLVPILVALQ